MSFLQVLLGGEGIKMERKELEKLYGEVYDTKELMEHFIVEIFLAPFITVTRRADGVKGSMEFQHRPRFYFDFKPTTVKGWYDVLIDRWGND